MIKCGVCGSENEAAALFCGTCGSPLNPAQAQEIVEEATKTEVVQTAPDDTVVPGQGGARRDLGTGAPGATVLPPDAAKAGDTSTIDDDVSSGRPTVVCSVCGTVNDATRTYCRKCANELKPAPPPPPPPAVAPVARRISPVAIGLGAAAVVVAIALIGVLAFGGGTPAASLKPTAQASPPVASIAAPSAAPTVLPSASASTFKEGALSGLIAFSRCPTGGGACTIYVQKADGSAKAKAVTAPSSGTATDPGLSHDRKKIVYTVKSGLRIVTVATLSWVIQSNTPGDTGGVFSLDGTRIAFAGHRDRDPGVHSDLEIRLDKPGGGLSSALTNNDVTDHDPSFTPDGKSIVYVQGDGDQRELEMVDIASGTVTALTTDSFNDVDPAVSPDGTQIVFASKRGSGTEFDLFLMNLTTLAITPLPTMPGDEHDPTWSPGGRYIAFSAGPATNKDLYILDLSNSKITRLTSSSGNDLAPSWQ